MSWVRWSCWSKGQSGARRAVREGGWCTGGVCVCGGGGGVCPPALLPRRCTRSDVHELLTASGWSLRKAADARLWARRTRSVRRATTPVVATLHRFDAQDLCARVNVAVCCGYDAVVQRHGGSMIDASAAQAPATGWSAGCSSSSASEAVPSMATSSGRPRADITPHTAHQVKVTRRRVHLA